MRRILIRVTGVVQGVWFRASTQKEATRLGAVGWVRNTSDGAVELEAQGDPAALDALVQWCHRGPPAARVRDVTVQDIDLVEGEAGFEVRRD